MEYLVDILEKIRLHEEVQLNDFKILSFEASKLTTPVFDITVCVLPEDYYVESTYYKLKKTYVTILKNENKIIKTVNESLCKILLQQFLEEIKQFNYQTITKLSEK